MRSTFKASTTMNIAQEEIKNCTNLVSHLNRSILLNYRKTSSIFQLFYAEMFGRYSKTRTFGGWYKKQHQRCELKIAPSTAVIYSK